MEDPNVKPAPVADGDETTTDTADLAPEAMKAELERARREAAKYRTRAKELVDAKAAEDEAKRQAALTAEQRAVDAEAKAAAAIAAADARAVAAERRASLAGIVTKPERVLRLMDDVDRYFPDGVPDRDRILADFSEYTPDAGRIVAPSAGGPAGTAAKQATIVGLQERLGTARTRQERVTLQRQILAAQKG